MHGVGMTEMRKLHRSDGSTSGRRLWADHNRLNFCTSEMLSRSIWEKARHCRSLLRSIAAFSTAVRGH